MGDQISAFRIIEEDSDAGENAHPIVHQCVIQISAIGENHPHAAYRDELELKSPRVGVDMWQEPFECGLGLTTLFGNPDCVAKVWFVLQRLRDWFCRRGR